MNRSSDSSDNVHSMLLLFSSQGAVGCLGELTVCFFEGLSSSFKIILVMMEDDTYLQGHIQLIFVEKIKKVLFKVINDCLVVTQIFTDRHHMQMSDAS